MFNRINQNKYYRKLLFILYFIVFCNIYGFSQRKSDTSAPVLKITWENVENNYQNHNKNRSVITLLNVGNTSLSSEGWFVHFNYSHPVIKTISKDLTVQHINGDLFKLSPNQNFNLKPNASLKLELISDGYIAGKTEAPEGFYLVLDKDPQKALPVKNTLLVNSPDTDQYPRLTPDGQESSMLANNYKKNQAIKNIPAEDLPGVFPTPLKYRETKQSFILNSDVQVRTSTSEFKKEAELLTVELSAIFNKKIGNTGSDTSKMIRLSKMSGLKNEAYELTINAHEVNIRASTPAGIFYGIQSFKSILPALAWTDTMEQISVKGAEIADEPRFSHRGFLMDVASNFQSKKQVLKTLDLMALYKLNVLQFHLTDNEGWRLEIQSLPELTQVGAKRGYPYTNNLRLPPAHGSGPDTVNTDGSGFYSKADFIDILKYANDRHIRVVPEISTPGHAMAAIVAMDARYSRLSKEGNNDEAAKYLLHDIRNGSNSGSVELWNNNIIDVALPSTYNFIQTVVDELYAMYKQANAPLESIHFGGDEISANTWERSAALKTLLATDNQVKSASDIWPYYLSKINTILKSRNLHLLAREGAGLHKQQELTNINTGFGPENIQLEISNDKSTNDRGDVAYRLANAGFKVVLSNSANMSFNKPAVACPESGYTADSNIDLEKPFRFIPLNYLINTDKNTVTTTNGYEPRNNVVLTDLGKTNIAGLQCALWSGAVKGPAQMEAMLLPRLLAFAEKSWSQESQWVTEKDTLKGKKLYQNEWSSFINLLGKKELPRLSYYSGGFQYTIPAPGAIITDGKIAANVQLPGFTIRYTTNGSAPTPRSKTYSEPIPAKGTIRLAAFDSKGRSSDISEIKIEEIGIANGSIK